MVRILANGEIVSDDDPRVRSQASRRPNSNTHSRQDPGRNFENEGQGQPVSIFQMINQRLLAFGIPRWNIGDLVIEPIVSVGFLLALLLFGVHGLIFGAVLFAVSHWSTHGAPDVVTNLFGGATGGTQDGNRDRRSRPQGRAGGGHRLGR